MISFAIIFKILILNANVSASFEKIKLATGAKNSQFDAVFRFPFGILLNLFGTRRKLHLTQMNI